MRSPDHTDDANRTRTADPDQPADAAGTDAGEPTLSRRRLLGGAAAVAAAGLAGCNTFLRIRTAEKTVERTYDADSVARLRVDEATDDVALKRTDGDILQVRLHKTAHGETELSDLQLTSDRNGDTLTLGTEKPNVVGVGGGSVDLEVHVPDSVPVDHVATTDGDVAVRETAGDPTIRTADGDVTLSALAGSVDARTTDGDVAVDGTDGVVTAKTTDGDVTVRDPDSVAAVESPDGDLVADVPAVDGEATVRTLDGDVTVDLGEGLDATVDVTTGDGTITVAGGFDSTGTVTETHVSGRIGEGSNSLQIHTGDGDVTVTRM